MLSSLSESQFGPRALGLDLLPVFSKPPGLQPLPLQFIPHTHKVPCGSLNIMPEPLAWYVWLCQFSRPSRGPESPRPPSGSVMNEDSQSSAKLSSHGHGHGLLWRNETDRKQQRGEMQKLRERPGTSFQLSSPGRVPWRALSSPSNSVW